MDSLSKKQSLMSKLLKKMIVAYLRVSTGHQVLDNQSNEISKYADAKGIIIDKWVTEVVSGKRKGSERKLGAAIKKMKEGDMLIVTEISRLSRTLMDIMSIMGTLLQKGVNLYSIKDGYSFDNSINSKVLIFAFGLVAEIERNLISLRTKEALELRKLQGVKLGRPKNTLRKMNILIDNVSCIVKALERGEPKAKICRRYRISFSTFTRFEKLYLIEPSKI